MSLFPHPHAREIAEQAFGDLHDAAPVEAPGWAQLAEVEQNHLVRFAERVLATVSDVTTMTYLPPDADDLRLCGYAILPTCPLCGGTPGTMTRYNPSTRIYRAMVSCSGCMCEVGYNALDRDEAREGAIARWKRRPAKPEGRA